ncbi:MAG: hypothetical protein FK734_18290 [Asgard group archaeon]|nr:hypothetical protein [Asgard group archaeon]
MIEFEHFIGIIKPVRGEDFITNPTEEEMKIMSDHFDYLKGLLEKGELLLAGPTLNSKNPFGLYIFKCKSLEEARELFEADPSIKAGVQEIIELEPFKLSLFKP